MLVKVECVVRLIHAAPGGSCGSRSETLDWHSTMSLPNRIRIILPRSQGAYHLVRPTTSAGCAHFATNSKRKKNIKRAGTARSEYPRLSALHNETLTKPTVFGTSHSIYTTARPNYRRFSTCVSASCRYCTFKSITGFSRENLGSLEKPIKTRYLGGRSARQ